MHTRVISSRLALIVALAGVLMLAACGQTGTSANTQSTATSTPVLDAYGTPVAFPTTAPQRIVSLVPNISEILGALNLKSRIVGVDYNTNYPADIAALPKVSDALGAYNVEQIVALKPDLVLSAGGLSKDVDSKLASAGLHVVDFPPEDIAKTLQHINAIGRLTFTESAASKLVQQMQKQIDQIKTKVAGSVAPKVLLEIDDSTPGKPYVFGGGSFGDDLAQDANVANIFHTDTTGAGYPQVTDESIIAANPQFVILTEEPAYGGNPGDVYKRPNWSGVEAVKSQHVYYINSDLMQRAGPRLVQGLQCLAQVTHPDKFSGTLPAYCTGSV